MQTAKFLKTNHCIHVYGFQKIRLGALLMLFKMEAMSMFCIYCAEGPKLKICIIYVCEMTCM